MLKDLDCFIFAAQSRVGVEVFDLVHQRYSS
jgi:hypothetical protein